MHAYTNQILELKKATATFKAFIKRPASGCLPFDYLVPAGPYQQQWDWDAFFMGVSMASEISSESVYLRNWVLNFITNSKANGRVVGCITESGSDERLNQMKPLLAQGAYLAGKFLKDYKWIKPYWSKLKKIVLYREKYLWNKKYDLGVWYDGMESGADNNVAVLDYPKSTVVATDLNTLIYLEYKAISLIAQALGKIKDEKKFYEKADKILENLQKYLWNEEDTIFYNIDSTTGEHIKRVSYSSFVPLWGKIASTEQGKSIIKKYLLHPQFMWSKYGVRTLAQNDPDYNNENIMKPYSNWQGPIWVISNYIYMHGLLNYNFQNEAIELADKTSKMILKDIQSSGGMHENYDAETGEPLAAPNKIGWNILASNMLEEAIENKNPFAI